MRPRILVMALAALALAGCEQPTGDPITEDIFMQSSQPAPQLSAPLPAPSQTTTTELGPDGRPIDPALAMVEEDPYDQTIETPGGLTERLPDTCKLENYQQYRGMSAAEIQASGLTVPFRVVGPTDIVSQEYNPMRVNFYTDANGKISQISCG